MSALHQKSFDELITETTVIIECIKGKINNDTDVVWTGYENLADLSIDLDDLLGRLTDKDVTVFEAINGKFMPTGSFQELSISNGWGDEFITLADQFDAIYSQVRNLRH